MASIVAAETRAVAAASTASGAGKRVDFASVLRPLARLSANLGQVGTDERNTLLKTFGGQSVIAKTPQHRLVDWTHAYGFQQWCTLFSSLIIIAHKRSRDKQRCRSGAPWTRNTAPALAQTNASTCLPASSA